MSRLQLYGTDWCLKSTAIRNYLQSRWIEFDDFNVELDVEAEQRVRGLYEGKLKFPVLIYEGEHLKNPKIPELNVFLDKHKIS